MSDKDSLEEQNIANLIEFYEAELRLVLDGASVEDVFNASDRKRLRDKGILGARAPQRFAFFFLRGPLSLC